MEQIPISSHERKTETCQRTKTTREQISPHSKIQDRMHSGAKDARRGSNSELQRYTGRKHPTLTTLSTAQQKIVTAYSTETNPAEDSNMEFEEKKILRCIDCKRNIQTSKIKKCKHPFGREEWLHGCPICGGIYTFRELCAQKCCYHVGEEGFYINKKLIQLCPTHAAHYRKEQTK